ncbi:hypothetical protein LTR99_000134 [Exophiala xenobiotica]|uniref:Zn(2)-C6 fungal-type domain-containing protein n=1 Tax=Vermiconidia calcicola TaxID=1690605 RepID=A0AAV9PUV9_9PEZI|nr:hypothetical protein LTR92_009133 [Exophiala xenobiotica]KAK5530057.1 hypothetical protein LTR25_009302 [Vermiconidia calcicola]KAK5547377.1 hypothetical protein LTR23_002598 [Chaetothyriales sp. CCFEE 6169]KAK5231552.1 hypothetical protein LTR72_000735 [Exophiala xenobiotica]KAK5265410.1 hypothetical protein LTR96_009313 [Exophiala xenobiotica]
MYHNFKVNSAAFNNAADQEAAKRRTSNFRACEPCRRRKIRCDGSKPCENCQRYRAEPSCHYVEAARRLSHAKRSAERFNQDLEDYREVFQQLFPGSDPRKLKGLSRERLLELLMTNTAPQETSPSTLTVDDSSPLSEEAEVLERFQPMPDAEHSTLDDELRDIADDVNALSLSVNEAPSYVGISSVGAALRVIEWLRPGSLPRKPPSPQYDPPSTRHEGHRRQFANASAPSEPSASAAWDEIPLINAFFEFVHPSIPLLDETSFRHTYLAGHRRDSRWYLLLNTVLAMGSVVAGPTAESSNHWTYFARASDYLTIDTLNNAHFEIIQSLAILSGLYLHVLQRPTQANVLMGAALRLAIILGLHKDFTEAIASNTTQISTLSTTADMRRRIWWSLFMLDSWAANGLGRPTMGRLSSGVTVKLPQDPIGSSPILLRLIQENIRLSILSTKMEDALATSPILNEDERQALDASYVGWFESSSARNKTPILRESLGVNAMSNLMRWRYLWHRSIIHRPYLLWYLTRREPLEKLSREKRNAVDLCYRLCGELIEDIATTWQGRKACQFAGWNATWLIYQASMTPLLCLFCQFSDPLTIRNSHHQIKLVLKTLGDLQPWFATAQRSAEVVRWLYGASVAQADTVGNPVPKGPNLPVGADISDDLVHEELNEYGFHDDNTFVDSADPIDAVPSPPFSNDFFGSLGWSTDWDTAMVDFDIPGFGTEAETDLTDEYR